MRLPIFELEFLPRDYRLFMVVQSATLLQPDQVA